jgi:hypothetical protein
MSKGSKPRPILVSNEEYANRWDAIFGKEKTETDLPKTIDEKSVLDYNVSLSTKESHGTQRRRS